MVGTEIETSGGQASVNLDVDREGNVEFQRYATSIKGTNLYFYQALCGWTIKHERTTAKIEVAGIEDEIRTVIYDINDDTRLCNEKCADYLLNQLYPLISHTTQLGILTERQISDLWDTLIDEVNFTLDANMCDKGNTFMIKPEYYGSIIAFCCAFSPYTRKATGGFMTEAMEKTITAIQSYMHRDEGMPTSKQGGFWDFLKIGGKK